MKLREIQTAIYQDMIKLLAQKKYDTANVNSLFKGPWGPLFYMFYYEQYVDDTQNHAVGYLEQLYEAFDPTPGTNYSYCTGNTGPFWLLHHLSRHDFIDIDIDYLAADFIAASVLECEFYLAQQNFDFLHGAGGICTFLVEFADRKEVKEILEKFVDGLMNVSRLTDKGRSMPIFFMLDKPTREGVDAFSLAHGVCSLQILLLRIHKAGIAQETCKKLIEESIAFVLNHKNVLPPDSQQALFPGILDGMASSSRLSWCYGDLNVAMALWHCGKYFRENKWMDEALSIMHYNIRRDTDEAAGIVDTCLCHGTAGIAAFYRKFWHETNDKAFYQCAEHWHQNTLGKITFPEDPSVNGIRAWQGKDKQWEYCWDLLDGSSGVGLSLISHDQNEPLPWDEFLLLT
ncbi:MAG TPA: lanthionine synthetase LanC family protein [Chitinophaga sp.]|uniref:lanthionine synthetase LanC family protein n=1 Tax=Chitinophaga sp. TaxID=1869181 RepID=UPI002C28EE89|nr:lanthionine synthetase LanC family protein [Chitinophaga sp.]HVI43539.1 lanthionine synthetase LanC family protein [Chitinophaga sp.]